MERFRKYSGAELNLESVRDAGGLASYGIACTYLPEPLEEFDEIEFRTSFGGQNNIVITVTVEAGRIKRLMFSVADEANPDVIRSLSESLLADLLSEKGGLLAGFFDYITG